MEATKHWWAIFILTAAVYIIYAYIQPIYTYALLDPRFDAHQYTKIYYFFKHSLPNYQVSFPFNTRILAPWLASFLPFAEPSANFIWLNGFFVLLTVGLLSTIWQRLHIRPFWRAVGIFWILFHWKGIIRMYLPDPINVDIGGFLWLTSLLGIVWLSTSPKPVHHYSRWVIAAGLMLVAIVGTLQKESFIAALGISAVVFFLNKKRLNDPSTLLFTLIALGVSIGVYYWVSMVFPPAHPDWRNSPSISILRGINRYFQSPELFLKLPISWLFAFGGLWLALITPFNTQINGTPFLLFLRLEFWLWMVLSIVGGGDTTRILFNGMPFMLTYFLIRLNHQPLWVGGYICLASLPLMRLYTLEPDLGRFPTQMADWCVECWELSRSWGYGAYAIVVLAAYHYLLSRNFSFPRHKSNDIDSHR
ncbi:hypothetical protein [Runella zeae]|uniref:hypothetical protein n=1 Tax=Runella zeae TaxID=94255 RepID=UPI0004919FAB|nr:hypothetical protein [Runella zeae]